MGIAVPNPPENMKRGIYGTFPIFKGSPLTVGLFCSMGKEKEP
jgi:hypothetical protein